MPTTIPPTCIPSKKALALSFAASIASSLSTWTSGSFADEAEAVLAVLPPPPPPASAAAASPTASAGGGLVPSSVGVGGGYYEYSHNSSAYLSARGLEPNSFSLNGVIVRDADLSSQSFMQMLGKLD